MANDYNSSGDDMHDDDLDRDETAALISADKVKGTEVYNEDDEKLGSIDSILIDKVTGEVAYVVMSFGGFLGIGEKYHPLPWHVLEYDTDVGGYRVDLDREMLQGAPSFGRDEIDSYDFDTDTRGVNSYYAPEGGMAGAGMSGGMAAGMAGGRSADYDDDGEMARRRETHTDAAGNPGFYSAEQQSARNASDDDTGRMPGRANQTGAQESPLTGGNQAGAGSGSVGGQASGMGAAGIGTPGQTDGLSGTSVGTADNWQDDPANRR